MKLKILIFTAFFFIANPAFCEKTLTVAFGNALAPWVFPETNSGIVVELITAALEPHGYKIIPVYMPYARRINSYKNDLVDVASDMNTNTIMAEHLTGYFSGPAYQYQNYLIALSANNFSFKTLNDIGSHSLISWQGATDHLGDNYKQLVTKNPNYTETHDQALQVKMLFLKRFDIAQMDLQIFKFYRNKIHKSGSVDTSPSVDLFPILGASPNGFIFKDETIRDLFIERLQQLKANGEYQKIFDKYTLALN